MNKRALGIVLLVVGIILLVWGINVSNSLNSEISEFFTGSPSDKSMWLIVGGAACSVIGLIAALRPSKE